MGVVGPERGVVLEESHAPGERIDGLGVETGEAPCQPQSPDRIVLQEIARCDGHHIGGSEGLAPQERGILWSALRTRTQSGARFKAIRKQFLDLHKRVEHQFLPGGPQSRSEQLRPRAAGAATMQDESQLLRWRGRLRLAPREQVDQPQYGHHQHEEGNADPYGPAASQLVEPVPLGLVECSAWGSGHGGKADMILSRAPVHARLLMSKNPRCPP